MTEAAHETLADDLYAKAGEGPEDFLKLTVVTTVAEDFTPAFAGHRAGLEKRSWGCRPRSAR